MTTRSVTILGAGLVGSLLAIILRKRGYEVTIYEGRKDMRASNVGAGRSINLAMSVRGWQALDLAGLREEMEELAIPMFGRFLHQANGTSVSQQYGTNNEAIYSVSRGELNKKLMTLAEKHGVKILFEHKCKKVDVSRNLVHLQTPEGAEMRVEADLLFGADGAFSTLRSCYSRLERVNAAHTYLECGYKELCIPSEIAVKMNIEKNFLHIWPRKNFMMIALPNMDNSFTCTLFLPFEGSASFDILKTKEDVLAFFKEYFPDAVPLMPTLLEDFFSNPTSSLITTSISAWHYADKSALIGDAAHAIVPFYGQGMNAGFEDCTVLAELIDRYGDNWSKILKEYSNQRKPNGEAVAELALNNFVEMRDKVSDPMFLQRKKIEKELSKFFPTKFKSVYEMVSFSHTPYKVALKCTKAQDLLFGKIMENEGDFFEKIKDEKFKQKVDSLVNDYESSVQEFNKNVLAENNIGC